MSVCRSRYEAVARLSALRDKAGTKKIGCFPIMFSVVFMLRSYIHGWFLVSFHLQLIKGLFVSHVHLQAN